MKIKKTFLALSLTAFGFAANANFFTDGQNTYHIYKTQSGLTIASGKTQIKLNKDCSASSNNLGGGSWGYKDGITVVKLSSVKLKLKSQTPLDLSYCANSSIWNVIFGD